MKTSETLNLILEDLKALQGKPLTWENLQWFGFAIEAVREVATPSPLKDAVLRKLGEEYGDYREILIRRSVDEHDALIEKAGDLRFVPVEDDCERIVGYRIGVQSL